MDCLSILYCCCLVFVCILFSQLGRLVAVEDVALELELPAVKKYPYDYFSLEILGMHLIPQINRSMLCSLLIVLGEGGFSYVYRAINDLGQEVAVKKYRAQSTQASKSFDNFLLFQQEAIISNSLDCM